MKTPPPVPEHAKASVSLKGSLETLLLTLDVRQHDAAQPVPLLGDPWAAYIAAQLDYDFSRARLFGSAYTVVPLRARQFDLWTESFLAQHESATVLHIACGLDTRAYRVAWGSGVRWIDVDLPDVVELRRKLIPEPEGDYTLLAATVTEPSWLEQIPADRPTIVVMEGLMMCIPQKELLALIRRLCGHFPSGELAFDATNWLVVATQSIFSFLRKTGASFRSYVDDPRALEGLHDDLALKDVLNFGELVDNEKVPWIGWLRVKLFAWTPGMSNAAFMLRYEF